MSSLPYLQNSIFSDDSLTCPLQCFGSSPCSRCIKRTFDCEFNPTRQRGSNKPRSPVCQSTPTSPARPTCRSTTSTSTPTPSWPGTTTCTPMPMHTPTTISLRE
jgi:hypothetical protein